MKTNIFKKIISISFLTLFLFSFTIPFLTLAGTSLDTTTTPITSANWFYTTSAWDNAHSFSTESACNTERTSTITQGIKDNKSWTITKCVKLKAKTPLSTDNMTGNSTGQYKIVLENLTTASGIISVEEKWWYTYKTIGVYGNFKGCTTPNSLGTENACITSKNLVVDGKTNIIVTDCTKSNTKPVPLPLCLQKIVSDSEAVATTTVNEKTDYYPLAPLPGIGETCTDDGTGKTICVKTTPENCKTVDGVETCSPGPGFANYLNAMINLFIGICAVLAMIMIIMGGIQYMTSELISSKEEGKKKVTQAILGLLLALGSYAILNTINPDLLDISLSKLPTATITINPGQIAGDTGNPSTFSSTDLSGSNVTCPKNGGASALVSTANSFLGKVTYSLQWPFGWNETDKTIYSNCSTFVNQIYSCVGLASPGGANTYTMFNSSLSEKITSIDISNAVVNGIKLQPGDLLGWKTGENTGVLSMGHVVMYTGGTNTIEVHAPPNILNKAVNKYTLQLYGTYKGKNNFTHIIRVKNIGQATSTPSGSTTTPTTTKLINAKASVEFKYNAGLQTDILKKNIDASKKYQIVITNGGKTNTRLLAYDLTIDKSGNINNYTNITKILSTTATNYMIYLYKEKEIILSGYLNMKK